MAMRKTLSFALSLLGLFDSLYLLWVYTSPSHPMVCVGTGCDAVRASTYATLLGRPVPVYGVVGYLALAILIFAEALLSASLARLVRYTILTFTAIGFLFSVYLSYLEGFVIHAWCEWCVVSALTMTSLFILALLDVRRSGPEASPALQLTQARRDFAVFLAALFVGTPAFYVLALRSEAPSAPLPPARTLAQRLVRPDSHTFGNPHAPVTVVEFGDFKCPACDRGEEAAREIRQKYAGEIRFVFRQFPLTLIHPESEKAAEAAECAGEQGKFWQALDKFYAEHDDLGVPALKRYAGQLGLNQKQFDQCLDSGAMVARIHRDVEDARELGVYATPTFFINRVRAIGALPFAKFSELINTELAAAAGQKTTTAEVQTAAPPPSSPQKEAAVNSPPVKPKTSSAMNQPTPPSGGSLGATSGGLFTTAFQNSSTTCSEEDAAKQQPQEIRTSELRQLLERNPRPFLVDVRPAKDFSAAKIPGAVNIPVDQMERKWKTLPKGKTIILYESGNSSGDVCAASRAAGRILLSHGFPFGDVKVYQDGLAGWEKAGMQVERAAILPHG